MRPIKFRGRDIETGEFIYGDLRIIGIHPHIFKEAQCYYDEELIEVDEDSVAQLVFTDSNGREIYTGDTVVDEQGNEYTVKLVPIAENEFEYVRLDTELDNRDFFLKEKTHDKG